MDISTSKVYAEHSGSENAFLYTLASNTYFETLERMPLSGDYRKVLRAMVPSDWMLKRSGLWYHMSSPGKKLPDNGFKLHISATQDNARSILKAVIPVCIEEKVIFKVLQSESMLAIANCKFFPRASAHKLITVYPACIDQFLDLAKKLDAETRDFSGPYILSDKPINDSKVLFYRYGGFVPKKQLTVKGGSVLCIVDSSGKWIPDQRVPYFRLPDDIVDPFDDDDSLVQTGSVVLNGRYRVIEAITFSNCGGTYLASDLTSGDEVLIKEARPHTTISHIPKWRFYAEDSIKREQKVLNKLSELNCIARGIEVFNEGGHTFAVQQFIDGFSFARFRAQDNILLTPFDGNREKIKRFCEAFQAVGINLIKAILAVHRRNIVIGDVSPYNILIDEERNIYLVDLESSWDHRWSADPDELSSVWMTPGYRSRGKGAKQSVTYSDDWYAAGMVLFSMLLPVNRLNALSPGIYEQFMAIMTEAAQLPGWVPQAIRLLTLGKPIAALKLLELEGHDHKPVVYQKPVNTTSAFVYDDISLSEQVKQTATGITQYIIATSNTKRSDCLWPSDYKIFSTNPMCIAYGACGPALYLHTTGADIPEKIDRWMCKQPLSLERYPPGLYLGLSGIAYTFWQIGHKQRAQDTLKMALESDLLYQDWGIFYGASGCGMVCMQMYLWTNDEWYMDKAIEIGERIASESVSNGHGVGWQDSTGDMLKPGYAYGGSGIALFFLYLSHLTQQTQFLSAARNALEYDIAAASVDYSDGLPRWALRDKAGVWSPYWLEGGCGIGGAIIRFFVMLQEGRYLKLAHDVARANYSRFTILPAQFEGLSGIGDFMLDMHQVTGDSGFANKARDIAKSILLYRIQKDNGIAMPGRSLSRISNDYGYGSAGVGVFLDRFMNGKTRLLHDLEGLQSLRISE